MVAILRKKHKVPLQELRAVGKWLADHAATADASWASGTFYVSGRRVFFDDPRNEIRVAGRPAGQPVLPIAMEKIAAEVREQANRLLQRTPDQIGKITKHRYVVGNAPVVAGTRIPTSAIWAFHRAGYKADDIIRQYPRLKPGDISATIEYEKRRRKKQAG